MGEGGNVTPGQPSMSGESTEGGRRLLPAQLKAWWSPDTSSSAGDIR